MGPKSLTDLRKTSKSNFYKVGDEKYYKSIISDQLGILSYFVYTVLKENFGIPDNISDEFNNRKWIWYFTFNNYDIKIYEWRYEECLIAISHKSNSIDECREIKENIRILIMDACNKISNNYESIIKGSKFKIIKNPYYIYYTSANNLLKLIESNESQYGNPQNDNNFYGISDDKAEIIQSSFLMFYSSLEGFLNILYELYLKIDLRKGGLYNKLFRSGIEIKLRLAPLFCDCFEVNTINHEDKRFLDFKDVVNVRNNYVHANIMKSLDRYYIEKDGYPFILEKTDNSFFPKSIIELNLNHLLKINNIIDDLIELVLESMKPKYRIELSNILHEEEIIVEDINGVYVPIKNIKIS